MLFEMTNNGTGSPNPYSLAAPLYQWGGDIVPANGIMNGFSPTGDGLGLGVFGGGEPFGINETFGEAIPSQYATGLLATDGWTRGSGNLSAFQHPTGRHQGGSNFVMADGHAKWFAPSNVLAGRYIFPGYCNLWPGNAFASAPDCSNIKQAVTFAPN
jgi:prepilin-type processing-associated H-X9-DG protein